MELSENFSLRNALELAVASQDAYAAAPTIRNVNTDTSVILTDAPDHRVIAFPGTHDFADVWKDLQCWRVKRSVNANYLPKDEVEIHKGFCLAFESIQDELIARIAEMHRTCVKPIFVTGHSKGGALATRAMKFLEDRGINVTGTYTYGEPRGGNWAYARWCDEPSRDRHFRIVDGADCIAHAPGWLVGNRHSGRCVLLDGKGSFQLDATPLMQLVSDGMEIWQAKQSGPLAILALGNDHHIGNYIRRLRTLNYQSSPIHA